MLALIYGLIEGWTALLAGFGLRQRTR